VKVLRKFCQKCGFNNVTGQKASPPPNAVPAGPKTVDPNKGSALDEAAVPPAVVQPPQSPTPVDPSVTLKWRATISGDLERASAKLPEAKSPDSVDTMTVILNQKALIGRNSKSKQSFPQLALDGDLAVSRIHAWLEQHADGRLTITNAAAECETSVNGVVLTGTAPVALKSGDRIEVGYYHVITVEEIQ